jgi:hypothetical protein
VLITKADITSLIATKPVSEFGTSEPTFLWPFLPYKKLVVL